MENANDSVAIWLEILAGDLKRASTFYSYVFDIQLEDLDMGELILAMFPHNALSSVRGTTVIDEGYIPNSQGRIVYLNGSGYPTTRLSRVEQHDGEIGIPKTLHSDGIGYIALFSDCEGNRIILHSMK